MDAPSRPSGIVLDRASVAFFGKTVLHEITLHLDQHRVAILGRNGSGKTTLLRVIAGLQPLTLGRVRVDGIDPQADRKDMLTHLGILFQNPDRQILFPTVGEELAFGLTQQGLAKPEAEARVQAHLAQHGRENWFKASISTLSQGQRQWLCLQAVLLMQPRTILLDEPFAALDLPTQIRLRRILAELPQRLITVTHDPATAELADHVVWIEQGRVHAQGRPDQVLPAFQAEMRRLGESDADADIAD